jgi:hypothetical protein
MKALHVLLAIGALSLGGVFAQGEGELFNPQTDPSDVRVSQLMGATVYVAEQEVVATEVEAQPEDWESAGTIDDMLLSRDGELRGVLFDVGGFLGIGARTVLVDMNALNFVRVADEEGMYVVFQATREQLENAPEYQDPANQEQQAQQEQPAQEEQAEEPAAEEPAAEEPAAEEPVAEEPVAEEPVAADPVLTDEDRLGVRDPVEGFDIVGLDVLTAEDLENAIVYDRFDEQVSGISDVVLGEDGTTVEGVLIDVGGFLGLGARTVAVDMDQLQIQHNPETDEVRVYLSMTQEELENLPEYEGL